MWQSLTSFIFLLVYSTNISPGSCNLHHQGHGQDATGAGTEIFELPSLCKGNYPTQMHRKIDGAVIVSKNDKNLDCVVTFSAEYVSQRFLIRFTEFNMECGDRLHIYDSANAIGSSRAELSCRFLGAETIQPIRTRGHYVTLKFTADNWGTETNKFTMVITAFKDPNQGCRDAFVCQDMCITNRLLCDTVPNCQGGEDELRSANCTSNFLDLLSSLDSPVEIGAFGGLVVICIVILVSCICFCLRQKKGRASHLSHSSPDIYNHGKSGNNDGGPSSGSNNGMMMLAMSEKTGYQQQQQLHHHSHHLYQSPHLLGQHNTLDSLHKSGNWDLPAESQGYINIIILTTRRRRLCCMASY